MAEMTIADIGLALRSASGAAGVSERALFGELAGALVDWRLLQVAPGERWESPGSGAQRQVLVLDGVATFDADGQRVSVGSGQVVHVGESTTLTVRNDDNAALRALVLTSGGGGASRPGSHDASPPSTTDG